MPSALFTHLPKYAQKGYYPPVPDLDGYDVLPIEEIPTPGSYTQARLMDYIEE